MIIVIGVLVILGSKVILKPIAFCELKSDNQLLEKIKKIQLIFHFSLGKSTGLLHLQGKTKFITIAAKSNRHHTKRKVWLHDSKLEMESRILLALFFIDNEFSSYFQN